MNKYSNESFERYHNIFSIIEISQSNIESLIKIKKSSFYKDLKQYNI